MRKAAIVLLAVLAAGSALAESLAELAAREREKKENANPRPRPVRVFTDDDLKKDKAAPAEGGAAAATPAPAATASSETSYVTSTADELAQARKIWQDRAKASADELAAARAAVTEVQGKLDLLKAPHHQLFPFGLGNPEVPAVEAELTRAKERLAEAEKAWAALEQEAGQRRIPSRWLQDK
jgi:hypothetical protein